MDFATLTSFGWLGLILLVWIGLSVGSFLNVVIHRMPIMMQRDWRAQAREILTLDAEAPEPAYNLMVPRSACPNCGHQITALENIPVLSWLFLRGKCSDCKTPISIRYPLVEIATALITIAVITVFGFTWLGGMVCLLSWLLIAAFGIDYDTKLLPDQLTYPVLWLGLLSNLLWPIVSIESAVIGAVAGYLFLWGTYWAFKLVTGKEGMGHGDFKLFAGLGAWAGWAALPSIILIAAVLGLVYALARVASRRQQSSEPIPFGPFLAGAGWVTIMFRDTVLSLTTF